VSTSDFVQVAGLCVCMYVCIIVSDASGMHDEGGNTPKHLGGVSALVLWFALCSIGSAEHERIWGVVRLYIKFSIQHKYPSALYHIFFFKE
jgi:hypothetical protein